jgi:hypothetical protein
MTHRVHLVGTLPVEPLSGETPTSAALRYGAAHVGPYVTSVPAEGIDRDSWVIAIMGRRGERSELRTLKQFHYDASPTLWRLSAVYWPRRGAKLTREVMSLRYADYVNTAWNAFQAWTTLRGVDGSPLKLQVGVPGPLDLAMLTWGPMALRRYQAEVDAAVAELTEISSLTEGRVVYQLEIPVETYLVAKAGGRARRSIAARLARRVSQFISATPSGSVWIVHLCVGNPYDKSLITVSDTGPLVDLTDEIYLQWPKETHRLDAVHLPLGDSKHPAPTYASYYRDLGRLTLPESVHLSAGLADVNVPLATQQEALKVAEGEAGRELGVSTQCGQGRRPELLDATMDRLIELAL